MSQLTGPNSRLRLPPRGQLRGCTPRRRKRIARNDVTVNCPAWDRSAIVDGRMRGAELGARRGTPRAAVVVASLPPCSPSSFRRLGPIRRLYRADVLLAAACESHEIGDRAPDT